MSDQRRIIDMAHEPRDRKPWHGDHTDLVHVLWSADFAGLTLKDDFDAIASMIMRSDWLRAREERAASEQPTGASDG